MNASIDDLSDQLPFGPTTPPSRRGAELQTTEGAAEGPGTIGVPVLVKADGPCPHPQHPGVDLQCAGVGAEAELGNLREDQPTAGLLERHPQRGDRLWNTNAPTTSKIPEVSTAALWSRTSSAAATTNCAITPSYITATPVAGRSRPLPQQPAAPPPGCRGARGSARTRPAPGCGCTARGRCAADPGPDCRSSSPTRVRCRRTCGDARPRPATRPRRCPATGTPGRSGRRSDRSAGGSTPVPPTPRWVGPRVSGVEPGRMCQPLLGT